VPFILTRFSVDSYVYKVQFTGVDRLALRTFSFNIACFGLQTKNWATNPIQTSLHVTLILYHRTHIKPELWLGMVGHTCNPSTWKQRWEDHEFEASLGYTVRPREIKDNNKTFELCHLLVTFNHVLKYVMSLLSKFK
jgi:hypothetical protein